MNSFLLFLNKYANVLFFVFLQTICIILIVNYNNFHQSVFLSSAGKFTGSVIDGSNNIKSYFNLKKVNEQLLSENEKLRNKLESKKQSSPIVGKTSDYEYISAKIIRSTNKHSKNYLTIDKGTKHGVHSEMGVISNNGVVGITVLSSELFSVVMPLINTKAALSVKLDKNNYFGSISWDGKNRRIVQLSEIPIYVDIEKGDKISTSGFSAFFPPDIPVGKIHSYTKNHSVGFYNIDVKLKNDFNKIFYAYIIDNKRIEERRNLEKEIYAD